MVFMTYNALKEADFFYTMMRALAVINGLSDENNTDMSAKRKLILTHLSKMPAYCSFVGLGLKLMLIKRYPQGDGVCICSKSGLKKLYYYQDKNGNILPFGHECHQKVQVGALV